MPPAATHSKPSDTSAAVDRFMAECNHPLKSAIQMLRELILDVHPGVREGIKWNAPSYRLDEYFATTSLRDKAGIGLILHLGAKVKNLDVTVDDPERLLTWLGRDRASLSFRDVEDLRVRIPAVRQIIAAWITFM